MQRRLATIAIALVCLGAPSASMATGFSIFEAGARALGTGGAFAAQADDPSAIFFNPAGIADLEERQVYLGASLIATGTSFAGVDPDPGYGVAEKTGTLLFFPINAYFTWHLREGLTAGLGVFNPFGLGQEWENPQTFTGRHITHDVLLRTIDINPTIAWRAHEKVAIGLGLQAMYADVDLKRSLQRWDPNGSGYVDVGNAHLEGDNGFDYGWNVGVLVDVHEDISLGLSYRSDVKAEVDGDADFTQEPTGNAAFDAAVAAEFPEDQPVSTEIALPYILTIGAAYAGVANWLFEVDVVMFGWEDFETLQFQFPSDPSLNSVRPQDWRDKAQVRTGAQYTLNDRVELRGGYYFDRTPQPRGAMSPFLADATRHGITIGLGYDVGSWYVDAFGLALITSERSTEGNSNDNFNGDYKAFGYLCGLNVGFGF